MKSIVSFLVILSFGLGARAQLDYGNKGEAIQLCKAIQGNQFGSYREANSAIEDILSVIGAKNRFVLQPCDNINNALAVTMQGIRYIFYDPDFLNSISSGSYSSNLFMLAHEVGHHINGHSKDIIMLLSDYAPTPNTLSEQKILELEADEFAGFVIGKLGHSLSAMQNTIRGIADNGDDTYSTHPNLSKRLKAAETGYNKATGNEAIKTNVSSSKQMAEEYFYSAYAKSDLGDSRGAIEDYSKAIQLDLNFAAAYCNRGISKNKLGDYRGATEDFNKAIQRDPNNAIAYNNRGASKYQLGDSRGAIEDFNKAIQLDPNDAAAYGNRGISRFQFGDSRGAIEDFNKAIQLDPNFAAAYGNRGFSKKNLGDYRGAIEDFNKAIQLDPNYAKAYINRGISKKNLGDYRGAIEDFNKAIQLDPNFAIAYGNRGICKSKLGDKPGAIEDYNKAIQVDPNDATSYYNRGVSKYALRDKNGACLDWSKAGELGYNDAYELIREYCQ